MEMCIMGKYCDCIHNRQISDGSKTCHGEPASVTDRCYTFCNNFQQGVKRIEKTNGNLVDNAHVHTERPQGK